MSATTVRVFDPRVQYCERAVKSLATFYEVPEPKVALHPRFPTKTQTLATYQRVLGVPTITLYRVDGSVQITIAHEFTHYLDDLLGYVERCQVHSPGFYRRLQVTLDALRAAYHTGDSR